MVDVMDEADGMTDSPAWFCVGTVEPSTGRVTELGGKGREWESVEAWEREREGRGGSLVMTYPPKLV